MVWWSRVTQLFFRKWLIIGFVRFYYSYKALNLTDNTNFHPSPLHPFNFKFFNLIFFNIHIMVSFSYLTSISIHLIKIFDVSLKIEEFHHLIFKISKIQNPKSKIQILDKPVVTYFLFLIDYYLISIFTYN